MQTVSRFLHRTLRTLPFLAFVALAAGCASTGGPGGVAGEGIQIRVSNNLVPSLTVAISAATEGTTPQRLGTLVAGAEQTFTYNPTITAGTFRLIADRPGPSGALVSEPIPFPESGSATIVWELRTNNIVIQ